MKTKQQSRATRGLKRESLLCGRLNSLRGEPAHKHAGNVLETAWSRRRLHVSRTRAVLFHSVHNLPPPLRNDDATECQNRIPSRAHTSSSSSKTTTRVNLPSHSPPVSLTLPWLSTWLCSISRLSDTMQPRSTVTPSWRSDDVMEEPQVTLDGSSAVDRIVAFSTAHDWRTTAISKTGGRGDKMNSLKHAKRKRTPSLSSWKQEQRNENSPKQQKTRCVPHVQIN